MNPLKEKILDRVVYSPSGCWVWSGCVFRSGYGQFVVGKKHYRAHRLSWEVFRGPIPQGMNVLHKCDFKLCVNPDHLEIGSQEKNMNDASRRGLLKPQRGEARHCAKLDRNQVARLREAPDKNTVGFISKMARQLGVSYCTARRAIRGISWRWI